MPENPVFLLEGAVLIGVIAYLFYDSPIAAVFLTPLLYPYYKRRAREKMQQSIRRLNQMLKAYGIRVLPLRWKDGKITGRWEKNGHLLSRDKLTLAGVECPWA